MNPLLSLIPGFAQAGLVLRTLGITAEETAATDRVVQSLRSAPLVRFLPQEILPSSTSQAIQAVTGLAGVSAGVPQWLLSALDIPQLRTVLGAEVERFVMAAPDKDHLLSALGKAAKALMGDADLDQFPTLSGFIADGVLPAIRDRLAEAKGSTASTTLHRCRSCSEVQAIPGPGDFTCRFCGSTYQI